MFNDGVYNMSDTELERLHIIKKLVSKDMRMSEAAKKLSVSTRHLRRLKAAYVGFGPKALISKKRGLASNRKIPYQTKELILDIIRENYNDYGPKLASEKLYEHQQIEISKETLRNWMIEARLWKPKPKKRTRVYQPRNRRECVGELVQVDGSIHDWFEGRAPKCTLLVFIDDATSELKELRFCEAETTDSYLSTLKSYLKRYGKPESVYSDAHGVFKPKVTPATHTSATNFERALNTLGIELIIANTPQAKGRVERANRTLQDRLIKELRYRGISSIKEANAFVENYKLYHNYKFAREPISKIDKHMELNDKEKAELDLICSKQSVRTISKQLTVNYNNSIYKIIEPLKILTLKGAKVTICEHENKLVILHNGKHLNYEVYKINPKKHTGYSRKEIDALLDKYKYTSVKDNIRWRH